MLAELCLEPECRRGHGGVYDALSSGEVRIARLRRALASIPPPAWDDGRIRLAADVSNWLRPDAETSPERVFCHCYARGKGSAQMIPGWPCSFIAALEPGRTSWTLPLDAVRLGRKTTPPRSPPPRSGTSSACLSRCPAISAALTSPPSPVPDGGWPPRN
jgi:hypothetical protein